MLFLKFVLTMQPTKTQMGAAQLTFESEGAGESGGGRGIDD